MTTTLTRIPAPRRSFAAHLDHDRGWQLVDAYQAGDTAAVGELYRMYESEVASYVRSRLRGYPQLAEDLAGDVWVRALRGLATVHRTDRPVLAWLVTIARNIVVDYWKSARAQRELLVDDITGAAGDRCSGDDTEDAALARISGEALQAALAKLSARHRQVLVLRYLDQRTVAETADLLQLEEGAVKALTFRAGRALARILTTSAEPLEG